MSAANPTSPDDRTASYQHRVHDAPSADDVVPPTIEGFAFITTPPLPPFLEGGFGRVYRATNRDRVLVAVKVMRPDAASASAAQLWTQECALSAALPTHEHVVRFYPRETARWSDGRVADALVMEWLEGARGLIRYCNDMQLDKPHRIALLLQAIEGVAWMHSHGTAHCDLKSDNMLVVERLGRPVVKVTDFGGSRAAATRDHRAPAFSRSRVAPEVLSGDPAAISPCADVYSLCLECAELIGGPDAIVQTEGSAARARSMKDAVGLADPALDAIIARGTSQEPSRRYADAAELGRALRAYRPPAVQRATRALERWRWPHKHGKSAVLRPMGAVAAIAALSTLIAFVGATQLVMSGVGPELLLTGNAPTDLRKVAVVREKAPDGIVQVAARLGMTGVKADDAGSKRAVWGRIMEHVAAARPAAIVVDIAFARRPEAPALDAAIVEPIARVTRGSGGTSGVPVALAARTFAQGAPEQFDPFPLAEGVSGSGAVWGSLAVAPLMIYGNSLVIPQREDASPRPPLAIAAVASILGKRNGEPALAVQVDEHAKRLRFVGLRSRGQSVALATVLPADQIDGYERIEGVDPRDMVAVYPIPLPSNDVFDSVDHDVLDLVDERGQWKPLNLGGRVVVLGAYNKDDVREVEGRQIQGVWLHAAAVQSLLDRMDAVQATMWLFAPLAAASLVGVALGVLGMRGVLAAARVPVPTVNGRWRMPIADAAAAVVRWRTWCAVISIALIAAGVALVWAARSGNWSVPYFTGLYASGVFVGACAGVAVISLAAWIGCVRRAWCLDRV